MGVWGGRGGGGSSPLARGTLTVKVIDGAGVGLIPARAGNTIDTVNSSSSRRAHPRSRGEHSVKGIIADKSTGSSPLARGTPPLGVYRSSGSGLIPARAGNTRCRCVRQCWRWAHPRSRGEHSIKAWGRGGAPGSSPLARGTRAHAVGGGCRLGLIPARAGNTTLLSSFFLGLGAHPRSRGEHSSKAERVGNSLGSSPLARGTRPECLRGRRARLLIPARAGNTPGCTGRGVRRMAHPRSRGEHAPSCGAWSCALGSSPLARGTPPPCLLIPPSRWLIPARAGNTFSLYDARVIGWAHPRSRGEHLEPGLIIIKQSGSSPLARGTH